MHGGTREHKLAIKIMDKEKIKKENINSQEGKLLSKLDHPNIVKLYNYLEDESSVYLVMEKCEGSTLLDKFPESTVRRFAYQMLSALTHIHDLRICHLDIKPGNFILKAPNLTSPLKLIDFEFAVDYTKSLNVTPRGTLGYIAPELLDGMCSTACDIWSLGITLYYLISGDEPFLGKNHVEVCTKALAKSADFESGVYRD